MKPSYYIMIAAALVFAFSFGMMGYNLKKCEVCPVIPEGGDKAEMVADYALIVAQRDSLIKVLEQKEPEPRKVVHEKQRILDDMPLIAAFDTMVRRTTADLPVSK